MSCPDANELLDFAGGRLDPSASEVLELHLDGCAVCRDLVADLFSSPARKRPAPASLRPGDRVGRFVVRECLGRGGMGVVYAAHDPELERVVAIKLMHRTSRALGDEATDRLVREARAIARVAHPNVVTVFGMGVLDADSASSVVLASPTQAGSASPTLAAQAATTSRQLVFVAMERVLGTTMREWLALRRRTLDEILAVFRGAAAGLAAAHANGIVHRDFKPDNVMIAADGVAKVMDFGLARLGTVRSEDGSQSAELDTDDRLTGTGTLMGTPVYMAPEQHDDGIVDAKSDQYAFCVALFEVVCGERPFRERGSDALFAAKRAAAFSFPASANLPAWLRRIIARGLAPDPAGRFATMDELARRLRRPPRRALLATALVVGTLVLAIAPRWSPAVAEGCDSAGSDAALGWDRASRDAVSAALRDGLPQDAAAIALRGLDDWARRWVGAHALACASGDDRELACLASRRAGFARIVELLRESAPGAGARPADAVGDLGDPGECHGDVPRAGADEGPDDAPARIRTLRDLGRTADARREADATILAARERGDDRALGRALLELASVLEDGDDWPGALAAVQESHHLAEVVGDHETAARAALRCVAVLTRGMPEPRSVQLWLRHADAAVARAEPSTELTIRLALLRARAAGSDGDIVAARKQLEDTVAEAERSGSDRLLHVTLSNLGFVLATSGEIDASIPVFERDRETVVGMYGADHPMAGEVDINLAGSLAAIGEHERALAALERAEQIERGLPTLRPTRLGLIELNRASVHLNQREFTLAADEFRRSAEHSAEGYGRAHPSTARALYGRGLCLLRLERPAEAEAALWQVVGTYEAGLGSEYRELAGPLSALADIAFDRKAYTESIALNRRALAIAERSRAGLDPATAQIRVSLAAGLLELHLPDEAIVELELALPVLEGPGAQARAHDSEPARELLARARLIRPGGP